MSNIRQTIIYKKFWWRIIKKKNILIILCFLCLGIPLIGYSQLQSSNLDGNDFDNLETSALSAAKEAYAIIVGISNYPGYDKEL